MILDIDSQNLQPGDLVVGMFHYDIYDCPFEYFDAPILYIARLSWTIKIDRLDRHCVLAEDRVKKIELPSALHAKFRVIR